MVEIRDEVLEAWRKLKANNQRIKEIIKENESLEEKLTRYFKARKAHKNR
ncbi:hypothetical protein HYX07_01145 [Candidatus Woesearchaeota archaeon]|nr:hypothetical protein [Candidatus Woesearchaeota archaeon]